MKIQDCKDIADYLKMCGVKSVDKLTKEQVFAWAYAGKMGVETEIAVGCLHHVWPLQAPLHSERISGNGNHGAIRI